MSSTLTAASTAEQVAALFSANARGKTVLVTGSNTGLGFETARVLASVGANVIIACRSVEKGTTALNSIKAKQPDANVSLLQLDLNELAQVKSAAQTFISTHKKLDILINNAGVMACPKSSTKDGFESQFGVNHLAHFYLTTLLLPLLIASGSKESPSRVVNLSSMGQFLYGPPEGIIFDDLNGDKNYNEWVRYGQAKLANVLFSNELQARYASQNVISVAVHPGVIASTELTRHLGIKSTLDTVYQAFCKPGGLSLVLQQRNKSIPEGAATSVLAALDPAVVGGGYYYDCKLSQGEGLHPKATDAELAKKLWEESEKLVAKTVA
ncbi:hypothetical protein HDU78_008902 [Chytriomyces hyalinus]|nr:hypothetical protein HDU78_008902 [Chytriomyces hyalinus]